MTSYINFRFTHKNDFEFFLNYLNESEKDVACCFIGKCGKLKYVPFNRIRMLNAIQESDIDKLHFHYPVPHYLETHIHNKNIHLRIFANNHLMVLPDLNFVFKGNGKVNEFFVTTYEKMQKKSMTFFEKERTYERFTGMNGFPFGLTHEGEPLVPPCSIM